MKKSYKLIFVILFLFFTFQTVFSEEEDYCRIKGPDIVKSGEEVTFTIELKAKNLIKERTEIAGKNTILYPASTALTVVAAIGAALTFVFGAPAVVVAALVALALGSGSFSYVIGNGLDIDVTGNIELYLWNSDESVLNHPPEKTERLFFADIESGTIKKIYYKVPDFKSNKFGVVEVVYKFRGLTGSGDLVHCSKNFVIQPTQLPKIEEIRMFGQNVKNSEILYNEDCQIISPSSVAGNSGTKIRRTFGSVFEEVCVFPLSIIIRGAPSEEEIKKERGWGWKIETIPLDFFIGFRPLEKKSQEEYLTEAEVSASHGLPEKRSQIVLFPGYFYSWLDIRNTKLESLSDIAFLKFSLIEGGKKIDLSGCKVDSNLRVYGTVPVPIEVGIRRGKIEKDELKVPTGTIVYLDLYDISSGRRVLENSKGYVYMVDKESTAFLPLDEGCPQISPSGEEVMVSGFCYFLKEQAEKTRKIIGVYLDAVTGDLICSPPLTITWTDKIEIELSHTNIDLTQAEEKEVEVVATVKSLDVVYSLNEKFANGFYLTFVWNGIDISTCTLRKDLNSFYIKLKIPKVGPPEDFKSEGEGQLSFVVKRAPYLEPLGKSESVRVTPTRIVSKDGSRIYSIELSDCKSKFESYCYLRYCPPKLFVPIDMGENELRLQAISRFGDIVDSSKKNAKLEVATGVNVEFNIFYCDPNKDKPITENYVETEKCRIIINPENANVVEIREGGGGMSLNVKEVRETKEVTKNFFAKLGNIESGTITISWKKPKLTMTPDPSTKPDIILAPGESATITVSSDIPVFSNFLDAYCKPFFPDLFQTIGLKNCENKAGGVIFGIDKDLDSERLLREIASTMDNLYYGGTLSWYCPAWKELLSTVRENMKEYVLPFCYDITGNSFSVTFSRGGEEDKECWGDVELTATYSGGEFISYSGGESKENTPLKIKVTPFICKDDLEREWYTLNCFGGRIKKGSENGGGGGGDEGKSYIIKSLEFKDQGINAFSLPFKPEKVEFNENCRIERIQSEKIRNKNCKLDIVYYNLATKDWECVDLSKGFEPLIGYFVNISFVGSSKCKIDFAYTEPQNVPDIPDFSFTGDVKVYFFGVGKEVNSDDIKRDIFRKIGKNVEIIKCGKYDFSSDNICQEIEIPKKLVPFEAYSLVVQQ